MSTIFDTAPTRRTGNRTITFRWIANENGRNHYDEPAQIALDLVVSHYNKAYNATLYLVTLNDGTESTMPFDAVRVLREPAPRYSAKNHDVFADNAVAHLVSIAGTDPAVQAKIAEASPVPA